MTMNPDTVHCPTRVADEIPILYRDEYLFAVDKPAWWVVHRGLARDATVLVDRLKQQLNQTTVFPVHRLDRQTSGVLLFAADGVLAAKIQQQFETGNVHKQYVALVRGVCPAHGTIDAPVPAKEGGSRIDAKSDFTRLGEYPTEPRAVSLVRVFPHTGRFHQIRRHMKHINHPVIGDANYGKGSLNREFKKRYGLERMALHACALSLVHPVTSTRLTISSPVPGDLRLPFLNMGIPQSTLDEINLMELGTPNNY